MKNKIKNMFIIAFLGISLLYFNAYALESDIDFLSEDESYRIEKFIEENMYRGKIPGLSVTIVKDDKTVYQKGFGYSNIELQKVVSAKTLFEIGSNSKAFTALGILNLIKEGDISLQDEVTKYIPWLRTNYAGKEVQITIEQLLYQTSGIPFKTIDKIPISDKDNALEQTVRTLINVELDSEPGKKFQYATINYDVLGLIIESITNNTYESYIEHNVIKPMGLNNTYLYENEAPHEHMSKGYKIEFLKPQNYEAPVYRGNKPAGYIISSGEDMAKWLKINIDDFSDIAFDKNIIKKSHEANRRVEPLGDGSSYASGWFVYQRGDGEFSHGGNNPNYSSFIVFRPEDKIGIAILSNINSDYVGKIGQGINEILQGENYNKDIKDLNISLDIASFFIIVISIILILAVLFFIVKGFKEVLRKERFLNKKGIKDILKLGFSFGIMLMLSYCIYLIPYILYRGVSWEFVFIWSPKTVKVALYLVYMSILITYIYLTFISFYKKKGDSAIFILTILSIISGFGNALIIFTINIAINSENDMKFKLLVYFILGIMLYVYGQKIVRARLIEITNEMVYEKRIEIVKNLLKSPYKKFEEIKKGRIEATLNNDTETMSRFANILISGITSLVTLICCFMYLGFINIYALLLSIIIILIIAIIYYLAGRYANIIGEESRDIQNLFFKFINDLIYGFKELSLNEKKKNEFEKDMDESCYKYRMKKEQSSLAFANTFVIGELLFSIAIGFIAIVFPLILENLESVNVTSYVFILLYMTGPVHGILNIIPSIVDVRISMKRINKLLEEISSPQKEFSNEIELDTIERVDLKLNEIVYVYDKKDKNGFKIGPISYEFKSGEITFITGGNGSGKSTLAKIITGLYEPHKGEIYLNNNKISEKVLGQNFSTVFSDFYLFDKLYGIDYKNKEKDIKRYLEILKLDNKLNIEYGKFSSINLSAGQKKRLALLVSYLEDKPIYLFDEWAADQDTDFKKFFYDTLLQDLKKKEKCVIAITHDDNYFKYADKVIKMDYGKIKKCKD